MIQLNRTKINMILAEKDLTQEAVAKKAHRSSGTIRNLFFRLKTNKSVRPCTAGLLAKALGVNVQDIMMPVTVHTKGKSKLSGDRKAA